MENKNKISKQKNTTNLSEPDANQENGIAQKKSDRRLDGANRLGTRYTCFRGRWNFSYHFQLFVEDTQYLVWKNVDSSLHGKRIHLFISPILYSILSLRRPKAVFWKIKGDFKKFFNEKWPTPKETVYRIDLTEVHRSHQALQRAQTRKMSNVYFATQPPPHHNGKVSLTAHLHGSNSTATLTCFSTCCSTKKLSGTPRTNSKRTVKKRSTPSLNVWRMAGSRRVHERLVSNEKWVDTLEKSTESSVTAVVAQTFLLYWWRA